MERKNGKIFVAVPIMVLIIILIYYFFNFQIGSALHPDATAHDMAELNALVLEQIDKGVDQADFYVTGVTEEEIKNINENLCSMNGMVDQYSITEKSRDGIHVTFRFEISDNFYVYEKYKNGAAIPGDRPLAQKLYEEVDTIINRIIEPGMSDYEKELAIHDYIVAHCKYGYVDSSKDYAYRAYGALVQNTAVCNGYAEAMALLLSCVDVENEIITGTADAELHAWNLVKLDGEWYQVDATWNDPLPDRGATVRHEYFNVTDEIMDQRHDWKMEDYPSCDADAYNYYQKNGLYCSTQSEFEAVVKAAYQKNSTGTVEVVVDSFNPETDFQFMKELQALQYFSYTDESYGDKILLILYMNQRE